MAIDNTFSSLNYNAYLSLAEADVRIASFEPFVSTANWSALTNPQKENVIAIASSDANKFLYDGSLSGAVKSAFNMKWPRDGAVYTNGLPIPSTETPEFIKSYVAQRCVEILNFNQDKANKQIINKNVKRKKIDVIDTEYFSDSDSKSRSISVSDYESYKTISDYVVGGGNSGGVIFLERA